MPHDVIMPALGMAQDTGVIVSWLKAPGEAVATGEPLLEVETDKATMEVEAAHDGYLTDVRAVAGDSVPVGNVVAVIAETPDASGEAATPAAPDEPASASPARPAGREIIMPALGMAQDTGKILAWLKEPGEAVAVGEALLEVETDKAAMEVEADTAGFLAAIYAEAGADVPVGEVIALITAEEPSATDAAPRAPGASRSETDTSAQGASSGNGSRQANGTASRSGAAGVADGVSAPTNRSGGAGAGRAAIGADKAPQATGAAWASARPASGGTAAGGAGNAGQSRGTSGGALAGGAGASAAVAHRAAGSPRGAAAGGKLGAPGGTVGAGRAGRVLASPKARRVAQERGLDIAALFLAAEGAPIHVGDLDRLAAAAATEARPVAAAEPMRIEAEVPGAAFAAFLDCLGAEAKQAAGPVLAAFAAGALRQAPAQAIAVRLEAPGQPGKTLDDPDFGLGHASEAAPALLVRDLTGTRLTRLSLGAPEVPTLTVAAKGETIALALEFNLDTMSAEIALDLVNGFAARLEEPLRQLL